MMRVARGTVDDCGRLFHVRLASLQLAFAAATGYSPTSTPDNLVSSIRPKSRTLADVIASAEPTPVRSKRRYVSRVYPGAVTRLTSMVVLEPKLVVAYEPSRT